MKMKKASSKDDFPGYYIDKKVKAMLDKAKVSVTKRDWDRVYIIDGTEGSGKSLLALQLGYYLDPTLNLDRITFSGEEFSNAIAKAEKHQCIIFDEAFNGLSSSGATSRLNRLIVGKLMECRQKNLYIIIVLPTVFLLQKYAAIFRSRALFHVYVNKKSERGFYRVYNMKNKKLLYLNGWKYYNYSKPYIKESSIFRGKYPIDEESYRQKKLNSIVKEGREAEVENKWIIQRNAMIYLLHQEKIQYKEIYQRLKALDIALSYSNIKKEGLKFTENLAKSTKATSLI